VKKRVHKKETAKMNFLRKFLGLVDRLVPVAVGKRTALCGVAKGVVIALRALGVDVPVVVDTFLDTGLVAFGAAKLVR
jgi:hypothetical protein